MIDLYDDPRLNEGETIWMGNRIAAHPHVIDDLFVQRGSVDVAFQRVLRRIEVRTEMLVKQAEDRLDAMVEEGNRRQADRMLRFDIFGASDKRRVYEATYGGAPLETDWVAMRKYLAGGGSGTRTYDEQKALRERWREGKGIAFAVPGQQSHHRPGPSMAIDVGDTAADLLMLVTDRRGRMTRYWGEPWHFEWQGAPKRKPCWKRLRSVVW